MTWSLTARRLIRARRERVFAAWTDPAQLVRWWGPVGVSCPRAEVDLRVGGDYRIHNVLPDGGVVVIRGRFEVVRPPEELVYSWRIEPATESSERVTVRFERRGEATEVVVLHERIGSAQAREQHLAGWHGCLEGLQGWLAAQG